MTDGYLGKATSARDADRTRRLCDEWAATYEAELAGNGCATPGRSAAARLLLREHGPHIPGIGLGANVHVLEPT